MGLCMFGRLGAGEVRNAKTGRQDREQQNSGGKAPVGAERLGIQE